MTGLNRDLNRERKRIQMSAANSAAVKKGDDKVETQSLKELLLGNARSYGIFFALVVVIIVFQILTGGRLLNPNNVVALFQQNAYVLIAAIGMLMVIIATHIDLSVGSVVAFIGGVGALAMKNWGLNWFLAIVLMIVIGLAIGAWHGFWVAYVGVPGFVTTLGGMLIFRGLATVVAGESIPIRPSAPSPRITCRTSSDSGETSPATQSSWESSPSCSSSGCSCTSATMPSRTAFRSSR